MYESLVGPVCRLASFVTQDDFTRREESLVLIVNRLAMSLNVCGNVCLSMGHFRKDLYSPYGRNFFHPEQKGEMISGNSKMY
jgi:hypothetical protein